MPMRREQVAAALRYLQDKADLRGRLQRATSLDPQEQDLADIAVETGASLVPGVGPALAARDFERARRADDPVGMGMAAASAVPGGKLAGLLKRYDPTRLELDVYHGTPHKFPATEANPLGEFDASKIGTGEGAQAYGHGVYLAESPDIAKHYQTQLGKFYDQMQTPEGAMSLEEAVTKYHPDGKAAAKVLSTFRTKTDVDTFNKVINDEILPEIRAKYPQSEWDKFAPQQGTLYKADLPDEMIDRMLDWDKPLSEQPAVLAAIKNLPEVKTLTERGQKFENLTGQNFYKLISDSRSHGYRDASSGFKSAGIPGIKYLDAGSRGQGGSGTRNFVVFPGEEKKVRILERK
jgi:hypothetical protein